MRSTTLGSFCLFAFLATSNSAQTPTWRAELLGTPPPSWTGGLAPIALNDSGVVVGNTTFAVQRRAWIAAPGAGLRLLPMPAGATYAEAFDVNSSGVVAGRILDAGGASRGVLWSPGASGHELFLLPAGPGNIVPFDAVAISDAGEVVGKYGLFGGIYSWTPTAGTTQIDRFTFPVPVNDINSQRQIIGDSYRMDLDTMVLEDLGDPTPSSHNYVYTELARLNEAGQAAGFAAVATSSSYQFEAVRYTDGPSWRIYNSVPWLSAGVMGISASGDVAYQLGASFGQFVNVEGFGNISLQNTLAPGSAHWDLTSSTPVQMTRNLRIVGTGTDTSSNEWGLVLLTPDAFEDLGGGAPGALGTPVLTGFGRRQANASTRLRLANGAPGSIAIVAWSSSSIPVPLFGGTLHANPATIFEVFSTDAMGRFELSFSWPTAPPGTAFYQQAGVLDPAAAGGVSLSNGLRAVAQ